MTSRRLRPSLSSIEARLCGPSDTLVQRWLAGDTLPEELRLQLESDPEALIRRQRLQADPQEQTANEDDSTSSTINSDHPARPDLLLQFSRSVRGRLTAARATFETSPAPGQVRDVQRLVGVDGSTIPWDFPRPLTILLGAPASAYSTIWQGWMVSPDTDYACYWDMVLEPQDEPMDPRASIVQAWNTVLVDIRGVGPVIGALSPERLTAVAALADDFVGGPAVGWNDAQPGTLVQRSLGRHRVVTGTPYGAHGDDPRLEYQSLYHSAAEPLRIHARAVLEAGNTAQATSNVVTFNSFLQRQAARQATGDVRPAYRYQALDRMAKAASSVEAPPQIVHIYDGLLSVHLSEVPEFDGRTRCTLGRASQGDVAVQVVRNGRLHVDAVLSSADPTEEFTFDSTDDVILRMTAPAVLEVRISPVTD